MTSAAIYIEHVIGDAGGTVGARSVGAGIIVGETLLLVGMCRSYYHVSDIYKVSAPYKMPYSITHPLPIYCLHPINNGKKMF